MAKDKTIYTCTECGGTSSKWLGKCPNCGAWNTLVESAPEGTKRYQTPPRGLVAAQRERVLRLASAQDEMAVLQRDVDSSRAAYDAVTARLNEVRLQSEIPQTNVSVLDRATAPTLPSSPDVALRLLLGIVGGVFAGVMLALFLEWRRPRVRTIDGFERATGLPVLADLSRGSVNVGFAGKEASA